MGILSMNNHFFHLGHLVQPTAMLIEILLSTSEELDRDFQLCPFSTPFTYLRGLKWLLKVGLRFSPSHAIFRCNQLGFSLCFFTFPMCPSLTSLPRQVWELNCP